MAAVLAGVPGSGGLGAADEGGIRRSRGRARTSARVGWRRPEVAEHEAGHAVAELLAGHEVDHGVLTGEDPAEGGFVGGGLEAAEGPGYAGIRVRANRQPLVVTIEGAEYGGRCLADRGVGAGVGGVGRGNRDGGRSYVR